ncbi:unnamed protein product [Absidia cylindrospora]
MSQDTTKAFSPLSSSNSQPLSPSQKRRRGSHASVEYIRLPSHRLSRMKYVDHIERPTTSLDFGASMNNNTTSTTSNSSATTMDADSFWLSGSQQDSPRPSTGTTSGDTTTPTPDQENGSSQLDSTSSFDSNTPSPFLLADNSNSKTMTTTSSSSAGTSRNTSVKKKKKKNAALEQKLFGHLIWKPRDTLSPALKAERDSQPTTPTTETEKMSLEDTTTPSPSIDDSTPTVSPASSSTTPTTTTSMQEDDIPSTSTGPVVDDLKIDGLIIAEHERDPFRLFDPSLRTHLRDPDSFVMPGLFASARARSTIMVPMMDDDDGRHKRILDALQRGTLGERRQDNDDDGDHDNKDMDNDLRRFIEENTDSFADATANTDGQEEAPPTYRKKFTQRRQTRLHKFRYVETTPSAL